MKSGAFRPPSSWPSSTKNRVFVRMLVRLESKSSGFFPGHDLRALTATGKSLMKLGMIIDVVSTDPMPREETSPTWLISSAGTAIEFIAGPASTKKTPLSSMRPITKDRVGTSEETISPRRGWAVSLFGWGEEPLDISASMTAVERS